MACSESICGNCGGNAGSKDCGGHPELEHLLSIWETRVSAFRAVYGVYRQTSAFSGSVADSAAEATQLCMDELKAALKNVCLDTKGEKK